MFERMLGGAVTAAVAASVVMLGLPTTAATAASAASPAPAPSATPTTAAPQHGNRVSHAAPASLHTRGERVPVQPRRQPASGRRAPFPVSAGATGWDAAQLQNAYALPSSSGGVGRLVAAVDAYDAPNLESDLAVYRSANNLPACTTSNGCLTKIAFDGSTNFPPAASVDWAAETTLDAEMISAACPNCRILVVEAASDYTSDLLTAVDEASSLHPDSVSMSWGGPEYSSETSDDSHFAGKGNIKFFASSGDDGTSNASWPAASSQVLSVGGTDLFQSGTTGRAWYEQPWAGSTHGCSAYETAPSWQTGVSTGCAGMRGDNDISANAGTAIAIYYTPPGAPAAPAAPTGGGAAVTPAGGSWSSGWQGAGGTSASSPFVAALYMLTGDPQVFTDPLGLYYQIAQQYGADAVNEIANSLAYQLATGLGSPDGPPVRAGDIPTNEILTTNPGHAGGKRCTSGDPVECDTGNLTETRADLTIPGRGGALALTRTYNAIPAATAAAGAMGYGWSFSYGATLTTDTTTGRVTVAQGNGDSLTFDPFPSGGYGAAGWVTAHLVKNTDGTFTLTYADQRTDTFSPTGQLQAQSDQTGEATTLAYDGAGQLASVTDSSGRTLTFTYDAAGHLTLVTDPAGRTVRYGYDSAGNLSTATDPAGAVTRYGYDSQHRLTSMTDPNGGITTTSYDSSNRVIAQTDPMQRTTTWSYASPGRTTTVTDPTGVAQTLRYTIYGQLASLTKAAGTSAAATWTYTFEPGVGQPQTVTDPQGNTTIYQWDTAGNLTSISDPLGRTSSWTYDSANNPTTTTDPAGVTTTLTYTSHHELASVTSPLTATINATVTNSYDPAHPGELVASTDADGHTTTYSHDGYGNVTAVTDPAGHTSTATFNNLSEKTAATTARGKTTTYRYDPNGRLASSTDPLGHTDSRTYDANGNLISSTDAAGHVTTTRFDADNEPTTVTGADHSTIGFSYDLDGRRLTRTDGNGKIWRTSYDPQGRPVSTTDPLLATSQYTYSPAGDLTSRTDPTGRTTSYAYDAVHQRTGTTYSEGTTPAVTISYDTDGRRAQMVDGTGATTYSYDLASRLTAVADGNSNTVTYSYDPAGNKTTIGYPTGITVTRGFDAANRLTSVNDSAGNTTTFGYDSDNNLTTETYPNGVIAAYSYDNNDQPTAITDRTSTSTLATFNYSRNPLGQVATDATSVAGAPSVSHNYSYTQRNQLSTDATAATSSPYAYDPAGNITAAANATLSYNAASELTSQTPAGLGAAATNYTYNPDGDRTSQTTASQTPTTTALGYDQADRLTSYGTGFGYAYNGDGLRLNKIIGGLYGSFSYDLAASTPHVLTDPTNNYIYGPGGQPIEQLTLGLVPTFLHQDQLGSTRLLTDQNGAVVGALGYSPYGTPHATGAGQSGVTTPLAFAGGYTDSESGYVYLINRYYDPGTNQFLSRDPALALTGQPYSYVNGDPLNGTDPLGLLCAFGLCTPSLQQVSDASAAFGDFFTAGGTRAIRQAIGVDNVVNYCSGAYTTGTAAAVVAAALLTGGASAAAADSAVAAEDGMAGVRAAGSIGERSAGIIKNTDHIPSLSGNAAYRIPDELNATTLGEVKNVGSLSYTSQLQDFQAYAQQQGLAFNLYVRGSTSLSGPLQNAVDSGFINLFRILPG